MNKNLVNIMITSFGISILSMCSGLSQRDRNITNKRVVSPLINEGKSLKIKNKNGMISIKSKSERVRFIEWKTGSKEITLSKHNWGKSSWDNMVNPIGSGYLCGGAGFIGNGGITRVVYTEDTLIFENERERTEYINYPFNRNIYDMRNIDKDIYAGFAFDTDREQLSVSIEKLELIK